MGGIWEYKEGVGILRSSHSIRQRLEMEKGVFVSLFTFGQFRGSMVI